MKNRLMSAAAISAIALGTLALASGCAANKEVLRDRPMIPAPTNAAPAAQPEVAPAPAVVAPVVAPVLVPAVKAPEVIKPSTEVVPK